MKIRPVGAELFQADGRTDMTKLTVDFRNFANETETCAFWGGAEEIQPLGRIIIIHRKRCESTWLASEVTEKGI
jgi:hypothetical protein